MFKKLIVIGVCIALLLTACGKKESYSVEVNLAEETEKSTEKTEAVKETTTVKEEKESEVVIAGKAVVEQYYQLYKDKDAEGIVALLDDELLEKVGGKEQGYKLTFSRMALITAYKHYDITDQVEKEVSSKSAVKITTAAEYESGQIAVEEFTVADGKIIGLNLPKATYSDTIIENFFKAYGSIEELRAQFLPFALEQPNMPKFEAQAETLSQMCGAYEKTDLIEGALYYTYLENIGLTLIYRAESVQGTFGEMSLAGEIEISEKDGKVGINYAEIYPAPIYHYYKRYVEMLEQGQVADALALFSENFYIVGNQNREAWYENLQYMADNIGEKAEYSFEDWKYGDLTLSDGTVTKAFALQAKITIGGKEFLENLVLNYDEEKMMIQEYSVELVQ